MTEVTSGLSRWTDVFTPGARVLLIVNSAPSQLDEIERTLAALERAAGLGTVSAIAPAPLKPWLIGRGLEASAILLPRMAGLDIEFDDFLERGQAVRWAVRRHADFVLGSEPYALHNEEVKAVFERRAAPMMGPGRFVVHSLPDEAAFLLSAEDLWRRAARPDAVERHRVRVQGALERLHQAWASTAEPDRSGAADPRVASVAAEMLRRDSRARHGESPAITEAHRYAYERLQAAIVAEEAPTASLRVVVDPPGSGPAGGWLAERVEGMRKPEYTAPGLRWHRTRLLARGEVGGPYAYLLKSAPMTLERGDALIAEGRMYRGGVTIGLEGKDGKWASRADVEEPGRFLAAAVARAAGTYALVIANHIKGEDHRAGLVLHRFGMARARR